MAKTEMLGYANQRDHVVTIPWTVRSSRRVVILGGSGFIGQAAGEHLHSRGREVALASRQALARLREEVPCALLSEINRAINHLHPEDPFIICHCAAPPLLFTVDLDPALTHPMQRILAEPVSAVINAAGPYSTRHSTLKEMFDAALTTALLMRLAEETRTRVIEISSTEVYYQAVVSADDFSGRPLWPVREDFLKLAEFAELQSLAKKLEAYATRPLTFKTRARARAKMKDEFCQALVSRPYARYMLLREILAQNSINRGGNVCVLRCSNVFGRQDHGITLYLVLLALTQSPMPIHTPNSVRTFVHVSDVAAAIEAAADSDFTGAINVSNPHNRVTMLQLAEKVNAASGNAGSIIPGMLVGEVHPPYDVELASMVLGFVPRLDLEEGIKNMLSQYQR
jgi:nucleoside-diphosphate-sugar epimerase